MASIIAARRLPCTSGLISPNAATPCNSDVEPIRSHRSSETAIPRLGSEPGRFVPAIDDEQTIYLIPEYDDDDDAAEILKLVFAEVFERELFEWHTDEAAWPPDRTLALFREWFDVRFHSVVEDLCDFEITDDEA